MSSLNRGKGVMLVVSAPSGTGKSTVCRRLFQLHPEFAVSVSYTTRSPRGKEVDGVEYHFIDDAEFDRMIAADQFLEWAEVHNRRYGSSLADSKALLDQGNDVLFDIDVQGGQQIKRIVPDAVLVFLLPPSLPELVRRLKARGTDSSDEIERRLETAVWELEQGLKYDYFVVNDDLDAAVGTIAGLRDIDRARVDGLVDPETVIPRLLQEAKADRPES